MASVVIDDLDGVRTSKAFKTPCRVATTANITLSGTQTIDGVSVVADDRVLVKEQSTGADNGVYVASAGTWTRAPDFDGTRDVTSGTKVFVTSGSTNGRKEFYLQTADPITIGTTSLTFGQSEAQVGVPLDTFVSKAFVDSPYTVTANDEGAVILVDTSGGNVTITLPTIASLGDFKVYVSKTTGDANTVTVARSSSDTINGATSVVLYYQYETIGVFAKSGTTNWTILDYAGVPRLANDQTWYGRNTMSAEAWDFAKGSDIASATTTDIGAALGNYVVITGTTTITGLGTIQAGAWRLVRFSGALTLTHNGTSLILPGAANITTVAGDVALFVSEGSGNWRCAFYTRVSSPPFVFAEGTWAPTFASVTNLDGTPTASAQFYYTQIGNRVYFGGHASIDPTASSLVEFTFTKPIASNFANSSDAAGSCNGGSANEAGFVYASTADDLLKVGLVAANTSAHTVVIFGSYKVI